MYNDLHNRGMIPEDNGDRNVAEIAQGDSMNDAQMTVAFNENQRVVGHHDMQPGVVNFRNPNEAPVRKLSLFLISTYKRINYSYYENKFKKRGRIKDSRVEHPINHQHSQDTVRSDASMQYKDVSGGSVDDNNTTKQANNDDDCEMKKDSKRRLQNNGYDDEHADYIVRLGEKLKGRYHVKQKIGKGSFGQVVCAWDEVRNRTVAIKIIKSRRTFFVQARTEMALLDELNSKDPEDKWFVVRLYDAFVHVNHQCLVFEMLSHSLYDLLRNTKFFGVSLNLIRKFGRQILKALYFLSQRDLDVIHCDLKPENVLLRHPKRSAIKIIDFGSSCKSARQMYTYIQSRFYRSPEVIFGRPYTVAIDMWSLGCILMEMHTGDPLFPGTDEYDQVMRIVGVLGMPPDDIIRTSSKTSQFFQPKTRADFEMDAMKPVKDSIWKDSSYKMLQRKGDTESIETTILKYRRSLSQIIGLDGSDGPATRRAGEQDHSTDTYRLFIDLIYCMLRYDPVKRIDAKTALDHPFIASDSQSAASRSYGQGKATNGTQQANHAESGIGERIVEPKDHQSSGPNYYAKRPGSAPAVASGVHPILRRSSRVAKRQLQR